MSWERAGERFEISRVLERLFGVVWRNLAVFAGLALTLSGLPNLALMLAQRAYQRAYPSEGDLPFPFSLVGPDGLGLLIGLAIGVLLQAALIRATVDDLDGRPVTIGDCLTTALASLLPLIAIGVIATFATIAGSLFFVAPGVIAALALCVAAPARVVEGPGLFRALDRSRDLTRNHRWTILLLFLIYAIASFVVHEVALLIPDPWAGPGMDHRYGGLIAGPLAASLDALIGAAGVASIYYELRFIKEGVGPEALAAAFD